MAYVLGFFTADGNMIKNKRGAHFISFYSVDKELLESIKKVMGIDHKLSFRKKRGENQKDSYRLQIGSKEIFNDLLKIGLTPNKSKTVSLPKIPNKYFSDFLRGYFDGDGSVIAGYFKKSDRKSKSFTLSVRFTSGSKEILEQLMNNLKNIIGSKGSLFFAGRAWRLNYSINDSRKLFDLMYNDNVINDLIYLKRKYNIFKNAGVV